MILVTGALGQIGTDLVSELKARNGNDAVLVTDLAEKSHDSTDFYENLDVTDDRRFREILDSHPITTVYHLASILSATGEQRPDLCWHVNMSGLRTILKEAAERKLRVFWPSSIAVFGPHTPRFQTPQTTIEDPATMYGITKVAGEMLCNYFSNHFGVDVRSVRYPGIISHTAPPGGGTTDYAVEIFHKAIEHGSYTSFVGPETRLPMMYMTDAVRAALEIMEVESHQIRVRTSYNLSAVSFSLTELVEQIKTEIPDFTCRYEPDYRQKIADSWPAVIDDTAARNDWGWDHKYDLPRIVSDMLKNLATRYAENSHSAD